MRIGIIGSGSWATALAKIVTDNGHSVHWWIRNEETIQYFQKTAVDYCIIEPNLLVCI